MALSRSAAVAERFGRSVATYDRHARLQARVARRLASFLPPKTAPKVLEVGCGTGLFTQFLLNRYPDGDFLITDLAPQMIEAARSRFERRNGRPVRFAVMDGEAPDTGERFDLIGLSMVLQWFADPQAGLERLRGLLKPGGTLVFATTGPDGFPEWRTILAGLGRTDGFAHMPALPCLVREDHPLVSFDNGLAFLQRLKGIGATLPRPGYQPLGPGTLRAALRRLEDDYAACVTWHIVYGRCEA